MAQMKVVTGRGWNDFHYVEVEDPIQAELELLGYGSNGDSIYKQTDMFASGRTVEGYVRRVEGSTTNLKAGGQRTRLLGCTEELAHKLLNPDY